MGRGLAVEMVKREKGGRGKATESRSVYPGTRTGGSAENNIGFL